MEVIPQYLINGTEDLMSGKIRVMVPQLMQERGIQPMELIYGAKLAPGTAYTLSNPEKSEKMTAISFDVLVRLCQFFEVKPGDILRMEENDG